MDDNQVTIPKTFTVIRHHDESQVSGTGRVLDGVLFPNGKVVICWRVQYQTVAIYESFEAFKAIHIDSHPLNNTEIVWFGVGNGHQSPVNAPRIKVPIPDWSKFLGS